MLNIVRYYLDFNGQILYWIFVAPLAGKKGVNIHHVFQQIIRIGVHALPMASLTALSVGITLAMQSIQELSKLGGEVYVPDLVSLTLLRELGPMLIAVIATLLVLLPAKQPAYPPRF